MSRRPPPAIAAVPGARTRRRSLTDQTFLERKARGPGINLARSLKQVRDRHGRSTRSQIGEIMRLAFGPGRVSPFEYFRYRLFDDRTFAAADKARFLGNALRIRYQSSYVARDWLAMTTDKVMFYAVLKGLDLPFPAARALYHPMRNFGTVRALRDADALAAFLRDPGVYPLFAKPADGVGSAGVASLTRYDAEADQLVSADGRHTGVAAFVAELDPYLPRGYLFQERLQTHPSLAPPLGGRLSSLRCLVMIEDGRPVLLRTTWKIPTGSNVADNFWRPGNLVAAVDPETGRVFRIVRGVGVDQGLVDDHPDTGARLNGLTLPAWDKVRALCLEAAAGFPGLWLQGWDIALTDRGPLPLEMEGDGGAQTLTQDAMGRGLLDDRFIVFLAAWRAEAATRRAKLGLGWRLWRMAPRPSRP
ncbi:MAG: hypothetical protein EXQ94_11445 [Alphaproteobacteria bacterium]|nr:hypothetical protein [Alphaproteobacteria bacterium]